MELFRAPLFIAWAAAAAAGAYLFGRWADARKDRLTGAFVRAGLLSRLFPQEAVQTRRTNYRLRAAALVLILTALAGPQWGIELVTARSKGTQVMIAVDTSLSMLTEDLKPNRMRKAQTSLSLLIDGLKGNRVGLIAFAGDAFIQCPLTTDSEAVKSFLRRMKTGMIPTPGTAIGSAVRLGTKYLKRYPGHKAIVLLTDGEDHAGDPIASVREAADAGIHLYIIGMGTTEGEPIPVKDDNGRTVGYKKDQKGETVVSRLNEKGLIELAAASQGAYYRATPLENEVGAILQHIAGLEKSDLKSGAQNRFKNRYQFPLALAVLLLLAELLIPETRRQITGGVRAAGPAAAAGALAAVLLLTGCGLPSDLNQFQGNAKYHQKKYDEALKKYDKADPKNVLTSFNSGAALYQKEDFIAAQKKYELLTDTRTHRDTLPAPIAPKAYYNLGNTLYQQKDLSGAAQAYKRCLLLDPTDEDCRHNLVLALRPPPPEKKKQEKKDDKSGGDKDDEKKPGEPPDPKNPSPPQKKPQNQQGLSKEDAQRLLQALKEKEKSSQKAEPMRRFGSEPPKENWKEDW